MPAADKSNFRLDINALRAFAVLAVIAYHFDILGFPGGFVGVDVFFVISGFLITSQIQQSLIEGRFSFANFFTSRLRRIVPALAVMCFVILIFGWFYVLPSEYISHTKTAFQALFFGSNYAFGKTEGGGGYFDAVQTSVSPFLHTWSLSIEGQFYLILPFVWVLIYKLWNKRQEHLVFALLVIALTYFAYDTTQHTEQSFYSLPVRAWEFLVGASLVVLPVSLKRIFKSNLVANLSSAAGLICIFASVYFLNNTLLWPSAWTLLPVVGAVLVLLGQDASNTRWLIGNWLVQRIGDMSYSLYLWHWPLIVFAKYFANALSIEISVTITSVILLTTTALSYFSWRYVEKPVREKRTFWTNKKIVAAFVMIVFVFWSVWRTVAIGEGFANRFGGQIDPKVFVGMLKPPVYGATCIDDQRAPVHKDFAKVCQLHDDKSLKTEVLVWGDSHMHHYYPAFRKAAKELTMNGYFFTRGGCHATLLNETPWHRYSHPHESQFCIDFNAHIHNQYLSNPQIKTVVLGRKWFDGESVYQTIDLVKTLTKLDKKVVLIGAIPKPNINVLEVLLKRKAINLEPQQNITLAREKMAYLDGIDDYVKQQLATEIAEGKVIWVQAMDYFCTATDCSLVKDGINNYWDASHITEAKALEFTEEFKRALRN